MKTVRAIVILLLAAFSAYADDAAIGYSIESGTVFPVQNDAIEMVEETVVIRGDEVTATFLFRNTTRQRQTVTLGFPVFGDPDQVGKSGQFATDMDTPPLSGEAQVKFNQKTMNFTCRVDGRPVARQLVVADPEKQPGDFPWYFVARIDFQPGQQRTVVDTYHDQPSSLGYSTMDSTRTTFYVLSTGSTWKGPIGRATVRFYYDRSYDGETSRQNQFVPNNYVFNETMSASPGGYTRHQESRGDSWLEWRFSNFEPDFNIAVTFTRERSSREALQFSPVLVAMAQHGLLPRDFKAYRLDDMFGMFGQHGLHRDDDPTTIDLKEFFSDSSEGFSSWIMTLADAAAYFTTMPAAQLRQQDKPMLYVLESLTRFLINSLHALHGYTFRNEHWRGLFSRFSWYEGNTANPVFPDTEKKVIDDLLRLEKAVKAALNG
jgi:hypothetical protein